MKPITAEYDIGKDAYGRTVTLKYRADTGKEYYDIHIAAANQRDDSENISGLTADNLRLLADAVNPKTYGMSGLSLAT